ncbi:MAG: adenosylcobinamide-phosphate synthase CbiB, partial [Spirochaetota bacterium]|nr:adenosylcobinamide-phosphate synthase CbiB [Spirochaetota bacterium]
ADEGINVFNLIFEGRLNKAREQLSMIVGRDTQDLNESEIIRATVETVAESVVDGVISPIFYAALGGAPLAMAYKAVNTLDSMVGYRNQRHEELGCFSARLDDAANFIPARISAVLIPIASLLMRMYCIGSIKTILLDGGKSPSPNSGISQAGFAGALKIQLGGDNYYEGVKHSKPVIGFAHKDREIKDIKRSIYLMYVVSTLTLLSAVFMLIIFDL